MALNIVLIEPEIPQNTGNIVRTAAASGSTLHLVKPFGFEISDKHLRRAGLDYWDLSDVRYYENLAEFLSLNTGANMYFITTKASKTYADAEYRDGDFLVFGKETKGLPEELLSKNYENSLRIPMQPLARSLNLSNSVAIVVYEALRQKSFVNLQKEGKLTIKSL